MLGIWKKWLKSFLNNIESFDNLEQIGVIQGIAGLANVLNLGVEVEDIAELVDYADGELTDIEALQYLEQERTEEVHSTWVSWCVLQNKWLCWNLRLWIQILNVLINLN
ncbi:hypothetical protein AVEN_251140-1 [Araneus ventricosus]|uniref:Uncharacterized protein n=1 Tax=Araneus ventricosus TaxID=182803 RepID=A0A4Y2JN37_ARAVE|nr:hypothetical protein AVEN_251140-1 [Araneus ventricosus]